MIKIGRNDLCPCKSGKKYKKCHGAMEEKNDIIDSDIPVQSLIERKVKAGHIKHCIHPEKSKCTENIIKAHSIQNNRIINKISRKGEVYMVKPIATNYSFKMRFKSVGRKVATTFTGFCGFHDKLLFQPIEDRDYIGSKDQNFLFAYRVFSFEYHKKMEAQNLSRKTLDEKPNLVIDKKYIAHLDGYDLSIRDSILHKEIFDNALLNQDYEIVETVVLNIEGASKFAVSSGFYLEYDLKGKKVNRLENSEDIMKLLMVNIFPQNEHTFVLFSWLKEHTDTYSEFKAQLLSLNNEEIIQLLNNLIPAYSENAVYNPDFIDNWNENEKKSFLQVFQQSISNPVVKSKRNLLGETPYSLFQ